jgi:hypothetical protein
MLRLSMSSKTIVISDTLTKTKKVRPHTNDRKMRMDKLRTRLIQHKNNKEISSDETNDLKNDEFDESLKILESKHNKTMKLPVRTDVPNELAIQTKSNDVPYSNLKHGNTKPTYSEYKTMKNHVRDLTSDELNEREKRMQLLREKFQRKQKIVPVPSVPVSFSPVNEKIDTTNVANKIDTTNVANKIDTTNVIDVAPVKHTGTMKRTHVETRLYKLGKTKRNTVSILLKDKEHSKQIIEANRELKKHPITDVKQYLRQHNLIGATSAATTDVLRKMYESALMTGDVSNTNYSCI